MMKSEKLFEPQGGPIIMSQIGNECGPVEWEIGAPGKSYTKWFANMAVVLNTGVPWMCKHEDTPDPIVRSHIDRKRTWHSQSQDSYKIMVHSLIIICTMEEQILVGFCWFIVATSYDYDAPLDEYGLQREPKYGHLRNLHKAIKLCEPALVSAYPTVWSLGKNSEAHEFRSKSGACAAFLAMVRPYIQK